MKLAIITGASKGLGASITKRMIAEQTGIIAVSRSENVELKNLAEENGLFYQYFACDLSNIIEVETVFEQIAEVTISKNSSEVFLFNNAGVVEPINTVGSLNSKSLMINVEVNFIAPMIITNLFLEKAGKTKLTIVNVTSGAANRPIHGWSTYCSTKAGLNMFTSAVALEQKSSGTNHVIIGYSPGIMDTDMQGTIRSSTKDAFQDLDTFKNYKEKGMLRSTDTVANALIDLLKSGDVQSGNIYNVNDLVKE